MCSEAKPKIEPKNGEDRAKQDEIKKKREAKPPNQPKKRTKADENLKLSENENIKSIVQSDEIVQQKNTNHRALEPLQQQYYQFQQQSYHQFQQQPYYPQHQYHQIQQPYYQQQQLYYQQPQDLQPPNIIQNQLANQTETAEFNKTKSADVTLDGQPPLNASNQEE